MIFTYLKVLKKSSISCSLFGLLQQSATNCVAYVVAVQLVSHVQLIVTPWTAAYQASLSFIISQNLFKLMSIESWCHPTISSSCPQSFLASGLFPMSQLFSPRDQSIGVSASASFRPKKFQGWSPSEWTGRISLQSKGLSRVFSNTTVQKYQFFGTQLSL